MSWDKTPKQSGGIYFKLEAGKSEKIIVRGEPEVFFVKWQDGRAMPSTEDDPDAKFRFYVNVIVNEGGKYVAKIWEQGPKIFGDLKEFREDYNLDETVIKISRTGTGLDTKYSILPLPTKLDKKALDEIAALELHELSGQVKGEFRQPKTEELPF